MRRLRRLAAAGLLVCAWPALANVTLPALISDHMVLQQGVPVRIWGKAEAGEKVRVSFAGQNVQTAADAAGKWEAWLKPLKGGGAAAALTVAGNNTIVVEDVLVGEVWVGSGQSNMVWMVSNSNNAEEEIRNARYPQIRLFQVKLQVADTPLEDTEGSWQVCSPDTVGKFSAVAYFFGRDLHRARKTPVGLIQSAWGGTPAQSWTSREALAADPALKYIADEWEAVLAAYPAANAKYEAALAKWKAGSAAERKARRAPRPPAGPGHQNTPAGLYNAMMAPITPFAIRGVLWYQGESNARPTHAEPYRRLFRTMIEDWRAKWGIGSFPFLFVQLANYKANPDWPVLRESQAAALELRNTGMAVAIDIGESGNIHPKNKQEVGRRLMLAARAVAYGEKLVHSGPLFRQLTREGRQVRAWFDFASGLRARNGGPLAGFEIAGADGRFVPAQASIEGETVVASSPSVPEPVALRYAWADDPVCNLVNGEGLPASPFRSR